MNKIILAIIGLPGAGKTTATEYVLKKTAWPKVYLGAVTFEELKKRGMEGGEANERKIREELRSTFGPSAYYTLSLPKIRELYQSSSLIIESLYTWEEYLEAKKEFGENFKALAIYSSPQTRIERMKNRPVRPLTAEELVSRDFAQIENLHQGGPIARADFTIINEGTVEELHSKLDEVINRLSV